MFYTSEVGRNVQWPLSLNCTHILVRYVVFGTVFTVGPPTLSPQDRGGFPVSG